jgi:hypothetical protein
VVDGRPTAAADEGVDAGDEVGRWGDGGIPSSTLEEHYLMEFP